MPIALELSWIQEKIKKDEYLFTLHADEERRNDGLSILEIEQALLQGQILESYPDDPRGSSALVYGQVQDQPIHVVCGKNQSGWLILITIYIPTMPKWKTPTQRNKP